MLHFLAVAVAPIMVIRAVVSMALRVNEPNFAQTKLGMTPFTARIPEIFDSLKPIEGI